MKKYINGEYLELSTEELAAMEAAQAAYEAAERTRPLTLEEVNAMLIRQQINSLAVDDNTALRMAEFYPEWAAGQDYPVGFKVQHGGALYKVLQAHTSQEGWKPNSTPSLYTVINETYTGELNNPIPYSGNMALEKDKYYIEDNIIYLCIRDTINPVFNKLSELIAIYVEVV